MIAASFANAAGFICSMRAYVIELNELRGPRIGDRLQSLVTFDRTPLLRLSVCFSIFVFFST